jgi:hypothetical protein
MPSHAYQQYVRNGRVRGLYQHSMALVFNSYSILPVTLRLTGRKPELGRTYLYWRKNMKSVHFCTHINIYFL